MGDHEDRQAILARRARLIATALAGLAVAAPPACADEVVVDDAGEDDGSVGAGGATPQPCLSQQIGGEGGMGGRPQPCLGQPYGGQGGESVGGTTGGGGEGGAGQAGEGGRPQPCLAPMR